MKLTEKNLENFNKAWILYDLASDISISPDNWLNNHKAYSIVWLHSNIAIFNQLSNNEVINKHWIEYQRHMYKNYTKYNEIVKLLQKNKELNINTYKFLKSMFIVFFCLVKPISKNVKPKCIKNTNAVHIIIHTLFAVNNSILF